MMMRSVSSVKVLAVAAVLSVSACESAEHAESDDAITTDTPIKAAAAGDVSSAEPSSVDLSALNSVARVDIDEDTSVYFVETDPGNLVSIEVGRTVNGRATQAADRDDPIAFYEATSGQKAPEALVRAAARTRVAIVRAAFATAPASGARTADSDFELAAPTDPASEAGSARGQKTVGDDGFINTGMCSEGGSGVTASIWRWQSGSWSYQLDDLMHNEISVFTMHNQVEATFKNRRFFTWSSGTSVPIPEGFYFNYAPSYLNANASFDVKAAVHGDDDVFTVCANGQDCPNGICL